MPARPPVRLAQPDDAPTVVRLLAGFRDWWGYAEPDEDSLRQTVERLLRDPATEFLLAGEPEPQGVAQLRYRLAVWTGTEDCWLEDLFVSDQARGEGLGAALVEATLERAAARGCRRVELDVNEANAGALALYRRFGFSSWVDPPGGNNLLMRRRLDDAPG
jgi:ribosomal protein S18 acetylase RimI-like enzyme